MTLRVTRLNALSVSGGEDCASVTVKNAGRIRVKETVVEIVKSGGRNIVMEVGALEPGQTGSDRVSGVDLAAGKIYPVRVRASTSGRENALALTLEVRVSP